MISNNHISVSKSLFGIYQLSYKSALVPSLAIENQKFNSIEELRDYLAEFIHKEIIIALNEYINWWAFNLKGCLDKSHVDLYLSLDTSKRLKALRKANSLKKLCKALQGQNSVLQALIHALPILNSPKRTEAMSKLSAIEGYVELLSSANHSFNLSAYDSPV